MRSTWLDPARPENLFWLLALPLGLAYLVVTPPMRVPDEASHFARVVQLARGGLTSAAMIPASIVRFADETDRKARLMRRGRDTGYSRSAIATLAALPLERDDRVLFAGDQAMGYAPVPYLSAIVPVALAERAGVRPLALLYVARLGLLAGGILLLYLAIRLAPVLHWPLCLLALAPTTTFLRSGVTADTLTTALAYLFFALVTSLGARAATLRRRDVASLLIAATSIALAKSAYLPLTLVVLALPRAAFASPASRRWSVAAILFIPWLVGVAWLVVAAGGDLVANPIGDPDRADSALQLALLRTAPWHFVDALAATWLDPSALRRLALALVGKLGLLDRPLPFFLVPLYLGGVVLLAGLAEGPDRALRAGQRLVFLAAPLACVVAISFVAWVKWSPPGSPVVFGLQGRYLTPLVPYLLFALLPPSRLRWRCPERLVAIAVAAIVILGNVLGLAAEIGHDWGGS